MRPEWAARLEELERDLSESRLAVLDMTRKLATQMDREKRDAEIIEIQSLALRVIHAWAGSPGALDRRNVRELCEKALSAEK